MFYRKITQSKNEIVLILSFLIMTKKVCFDKNEKNKDINVNKNIVRLFKECFDVWNQIGSFINGSHDKTYVSSFVHINSLTQNIGSSFGEKRRNIFDGNNCPTTNDDDDRFFFCSFPTKKEMIHRSGVVLYNELTIKRNFVVSQKVVEKYESYYDEKCTEEREKVIRIDQKREGKWKQWYEDGQQAIETTYANGK